MRGGKGYVLRLHHPTGPALFLWEGFVSMVSCGHRLEKTWTVIRAVLHPPRSVVSQADESSGP